MDLYYQLIVIFFATVTGIFAVKPFQDQPKLYVRNGHLHIVMPESKDVVFYTSSFRINEHDLISTLKGAENASKALQNYESFISRYHSKMDDFENRLLNLRSSDTLITNSTNTTLKDQNTSMKFRRLDRRVTTLQRTIASLKTLLTKDECASNPCKNGGVCLDMYNGFLCQCQNGWEGPTCEIDIDECTRFKGTDLSCQNGGTCQNLLGTYHCYCQNGWVGIRCSRRPTDCTSGGTEICGHGTCVLQNNEAGYTCICDSGWTTDGTHMACSVDVDECKLNHPPCSTNPLVLCTNVPGSFVCQHCPPGYTGNGYYCADINECELFNGGCSVSPFAECINIPGSSKCGPCPPGYQGDGKICSYRGVCAINNGGCSLLARCAENPAISESYVQCICPAGYAGPGLGPNGCYKTNFNSTGCSPSPCVHGTCIEVSAPPGFLCMCEHRYSGTYCDSIKDPCASNPCLNGGTCQKNRGKFFCKCVTGFSGKLCNKERQGCGESLNLANGTLSYPPTDYVFSRGSEGVSCAWTISTEESKVVQINFTKFNLVSDSACSSQWLQIHDGKNSMAPPLGRYCGRTLPLNGSVTTTHNVVYIWLRSNGLSIEKPEFEITWRTKTPDCGGKISGGSGMIASPGWPSNYPNNRDCYWYFKLPISKRLLFHIYSLNIGHDSDCTGDFLEFYATDVSVPINSNPQYIRALATSSQQLFANFCNSTIPEPFYSTFHHGYIHFKSNEKDTYSGFQIGYSTVNGIPGCGGTYTSLDGYIQSIDMTNSMPPILTCMYEIKLPINTTIKLDIVEMDLEPSCALTNVAIYQGSSTDSGLLGRYCGNSLPGSMVSFGNSVFIESSSRMYYKNHWKIKYETVCTHRFTSPEGSIVPYRERKDCVYHIEQPVGNIIILNMELTGLYLNHGKCERNYVEVRDGDNENSTLLGKYCRSRIKVKIESSTNYLWIKGRLSTYAQFTANYTSLDIGCGGLLKKELGTVSFPPQGSGKYTGNKKCRWVIMAPNDKVVQLTWMTFNVEQSFDCTYDHVEVFDNNTDDGMGGSMGKYCGFNLPPLMLSSSNVMTIDFTSDTTVHGDGFLASYTFIKENNVCGAQYYTSAGVIKSPGYPNSYPTNRVCNWVITVAPGSQIMLNVTDFNVEAYSSCRYDWLEIRNGGTASSPLIGRYCGTTIPKLIPSHANKLFLSFNSDMSRTAPGFKIEWSSAATGCGGTLTSPSGAIMSPHYPEPYTKNTDCLWKIVVSAGSKIQIIFADVDLEKHSVCGLDYIQIFDGSTINSQSLGKFCSPQTMTVISSANTMLIRFRSDISFQGRGFSIQYSTICTNTMTGFGGVIESPNFPNDYPQNQNCLWDIIVSEKNKVNITFSHFGLERSTTFENKSCQFDYVEIEYYTDTSYNDGVEEPIYQQYGRFCGDTNPGLITLDSNRVKVHFVSDSLLLGTGFRLEWSLFGCGGILKDTSGTISSPNYPDPYPHSIECNWVIAMPLGKSITITFNKIEVERDSNCNYDYLSLYNGKDASYQLLAKLCHQENPITVTSSGNNMLVQFKADSSYQGHGFTASYMTSPTNCGGLLTAYSGYVLSPNYPKNYNKNETCEWLISTDEHHQIQLEFEDVDLVIGDCNKTYIKVYDGPTQAYPLLQTLCGTTELNTSIKSTFENLFIEFRSDNYLTSKGFKAKYDKACGATIKTSGSGILKLNKEFIGSQTELHSCTYTIQAEDKSKHVTLTITRLGNIGWCDDDYWFLKIYNGPFSDSPLIGSFCGPKLPEAIVSAGSALHIAFSQALDFTASYSVLDDQCGGEFESQDGYFASPGWPKAYPNNIQCAWTVSMGPGNTIDISFLDFNIPESDHCSTDFLEIRETNSTGKLLGVYCGTNTPSNITAIGKMYLLLKTSSLDEGVPTTNKGFKAEYAMSNDNKLNGSEGLIGSPNYPASTTAFGTFTWLITTKPNTRIEITFIDFFTEWGFSPDDCSGAPFRVYDGMDMEADILVEDCSSKLPAPTLSSSNIVYITFDYYSNRLDTKFLLKWKQLAGDKKKASSNTTSDCQHYYVLKEGENMTISSPGYPNGYAPSLNCEWILESLPQYHLQLNFMDRNFGSWTAYRTCNYVDVIKVYQKPTKDGQWDKVTEMCNNSNTYDTIVGTNLVKIEFQSNKYLNGSGFQANIKSACGGTLIDPTGDIHINNSVSAEHRCQWNITVRAGRTIKLRFEQFDLGRNIRHDCETYLIIRNGKFSDSPFLGDGKFCGTDLPADMESSSNHLYLKYIGLNNAKGFKMYYEEKSINCGQNYQLSLETTTVEISSPNYPNIPSAHTECIWTFRAPTAEALRVDFEERFDIGYVCDKDYLELRDGGTELASLIGTYCSAAPSTIYTTSNMLRIKFFTDSNEPRNGFKAKVSISYCGGTLKGTEGTLNTKEPHYLRAGSNCTWYLRAPVGFYLTIKFPIFHVTSFSSNCSANDSSTVHLYEHSSIIQNDTSLGTYCGHVDPTQLITSSSNEVMVNYISKSDQDEFSLEFSAKRTGCMNSYIRESGTITSPGYPHLMFTGQYCVWKIQVPKGRRITMTFEDVDFDSMYIAVYDGFRHGPLLFNSKNTLLLGRTIETADNGAHIFYSQQQQSNKRGFKMTFTSDKPSFCPLSGDFNQTNGVIFAPTFKNSYKCEWDHTKETENVTLAMEIIMETNITKFGRFCRRYDTGLHLFDKKHFIANICRNHTTPFIFRSPHATITLAAQRNENSFLNFTIFYKTYKCGGLIPNEEGTISSPNFPNRPKSSMECSWRLSFHTEHKIKINITTLDLGNDCEKSYLIIYNGDTSSHPMIGKYCKNNKPDLIVTQTNQALIEYQYQEGGDGSSKGFMLSYTPEIHGCGGIYQHTEDIIQTPNYDKEYPNNAECLWELKAQDGNLIKFTFIDRFYIEESDNCAKDYVEIFDWKDDWWVSLGKQCGRTTPKEIISSNTQLRILFRSNERTTGNGFRAKWQWHCGGKLTASRQERYLMSPGFPNSQQANCTYTIVTNNRQSVINIRFLDFELGKPEWMKTEPDCSSGNLTIAGTISGRALRSMTQVFCETTLPINQRFRDSVVITYLNSLQSWSKPRGFKLTYKDESCGGNITSPTAIEAPSTYGNSPRIATMRYYQPRIACVWYVTAPTDQVPILSIHKLGMSMALNCIGQSLDIYDGLKMLQSKKLATLCGKIDDESKPVISNSNTMLVKVESSPFNFDGFKGEIYFTYGPSVGCGGTINLTETKYLNSPNNLPHMDCHWKIIAPNDQKVQLEFTKIKIPGACENPIRNHTYFCTCSFIEVRDGGGPFADQMSKLCSSDSNSQKTFTSSWSTAYLRLYSAAAQNDMFSVTLTPIQSQCGSDELTVTDEFKEMTSPNYPNSYPSEIKCTWVIKNTIASGNVLLNFEDFDLLEETSSSSSCSDDRLEVSDDPQRHIIREGYGPTAKYHSPQIQYNMRSYHEYSFCGKDTKPFDFYSVGNTLTLTFKSFPFSTKGKGFKLKYGPAGCNRTFNANEGRIQSFFQTQYRGPSTCIYTIIADKNTTISVYFMQFSFLNPGNNCSSSGLEIRENNSTGPQLLNACGFQLPNPVFSNSSQLYIKAINQRYVYYQYNFLFVASDNGRGCGGKIYNFQGKFSSPMYPNVYRQDIECTWDVKVPSGYKVALKFSAFEIGGSCIKNKVIVTTYDENYPTEHIYCTQDTPAILYSERHLQIKYYSSVNNGGNGWLVTFLAVKEVTDKIIWF